MPKLILDRAVVLQEPVPPFPTSQPPRRRSSIMRSTYLKKLTRLVPQIARLVKQPVAWEFRARKAAPVLGPHSTATAAPNAMLSQRSGAAVPVRTADCIQKPILRL